MKIGDPKHMTYENRPVYGYRVGPWRILYSPRGGYLDVIDLIQVGDHKIYD